MHAVGLVLGVFGALFLLAQVIVMIIGAMKLRGTPRTFFFLAAACALAGSLVGLIQGPLAAYLDAAWSILPVSFVTHLLWTGTIVLLVTGGVKAFTSGQFTGVGGSPAWTPGIGVPAASDAFGGEAPVQNYSTVPQENTPPQNLMSPGQGFPEQAPQYGPQPR